MLKETKTTEINDYIVSNDTYNYLNTNNAVSYNENVNKQSIVSGDKEGDQINEDNFNTLNNSIVSGESFDTKLLPTGSESFLNISNGLTLDKNVGCYYTPHPSFMPFMQPTPCPTMFPILYPHHPSMMHPLLPPAQFMFPPYGPTFNSPMVPMFDKNEYLIHNRGLHDAKSAADITDVIKHEDQVKNEITSAFSYPNTPSLTLVNAEKNISKLSFVTNVCNNNNIYDNVNSEYSKYFSAFPPHYPTMQSLQSLPLNAFLPSYNHPMMIPPSPMPMLGPFYSIPHPYMAATQNMANQSCETLLRDQGLISHKDPDAEEDDARCRQEVASLFKNGKHDEKLSPQFLTNDLDKDVTHDMSLHTRPYLDLNNNVLGNQVSYQENDNFYKYRDKKSKHHRSSKDFSNFSNENLKLVLEEKGGLELVLPPPERPMNNGHSLETGTGAMFPDEEPLHKRMRVISLSKEEAVDLSFNPKPVSRDLERCNEASTIIGPNDVRTGDDSIFKKGSLIYLQNGDPKLVENLTTRDFLKSCGSNPDYDIVKGEVLSIHRKQRSPITGPPTDPGSSTADKGTGDGTAKITLAIKDGLSASGSNGGSEEDATRTDTRVTNMEVTLSHLFFVPNPSSSNSPASSSTATPVNPSGGWASVSPERSLRDLGLRCRQLRPGDDCLVVLAKNKDLVAGGSGNGATVTGSVPPPPKTIPRFGTAPCNMERRGGGHTRRRYNPHGHPWSKLVPAPILAVPRSQISSS